MIKLDKSEFSKVFEPLREVGINHLFANAVVEGHVSGTIYVENAENPTSFYVTHPYGMSLLFGNTTNEEFNSWLLNHALNTKKVRDWFEWLQAFPSTWNTLIETQWTLLKKIQELILNSIEPTILNLNKTIYILTQKLFALTSTYLKICRVASFPCASGTMQMIFQIVELHSV